MRTETSPAAASGTPDEGATNAPAVAHAAAAAHDAELAAFVGAMPKAELHIHLEGSIAPATLLTLARRHGRLDLLPGDSLDALERWFAFTDFPHFVQVYLAISSLLLTSEDFATIVYACGADMAAQNIRYREVTFTPFTHTHLQQKGLSFDDLLSGLEEGRAQARSDFGVEMRWVFDIPRNASFGAGGRYDPAPAEQTLQYALRGLEQGSVVGFGLGGWEVGAPPAPFAHAFQRAKEAGLLSVPHAGETAGPDSVRDAVLLLGADRIGHGVRAIEDPALVELLRERGVVLEVNPTSNLRLHVYPGVESHPFRALDELGLEVTVNSDDPPLFNCTLSGEYALLAQGFGYEREDLARIGRRAFEHAGCPPTLKQSLLDEFDGWAAGAL